jgi:hypothetical protein
MVVDRINRAVLKFLGRRSKAASGSIHVDAEGIEARSGSNVLWSMRWTEIQRITAFRSAGFVGDALVLAIERPGESRLISEGHEGWHELTTTLSKYLEGAQEYQAWALRLIGSKEGQRVIVFDRS